MSFQGTTRTDPCLRVDAYGSYHGSMAAKLLAAHRPVPWDMQFLISSPPPEPKF